MVWLFPALFGIGCLIALYQARGEGLRLSLAFGLAAVWASANLLWLAGSIQMIAIPDFALGVVALLVWVERHTRWATQMVILSYLRLAAHAMFEMTGGTYVIPFIHALNALFVLQLIAVSMPGGIHGLTRLLSVFGLHHFRRPVRAAPRTQEP